jgi:hypothetical protein
MSLRDLELWSLPCKLLALRVAALITGNHYHYYYVIQIFGV